MLSIKKIQIKNKYLAVAIEAIAQTQPIIDHYFDNKNLNITLKPGSSPVTIADKKVEQIITSYIKKEFPDHSFLGEEQGQTGPRSPFTWIIDPIDGTKSFIRGLPTFGTFVALAHKQEIVVGISYMPLFNWLAYAVKGKGSFYNHQSIQLSKVDVLSESYVSTASLKYFNLIDQVDGLIKVCQSVRHLRSYPEIQGWHYLMQGKLDAQIEAKGFVWDLAAHSLILEEAGAKVTQIDGQPFTLKSSNIIASNPKLHAQLTPFFNKKQ